MRKALACLLAALLALGAHMPNAGALGTLGALGEETDNVLKVDWNARYTLNELEAFLASLADACPERVSLFSIGESHLGNDILCATVSFGDDSQNATEIAILAGIHGDEREAVTCAMYFLWWAALSGEDAQEALSGYTIHVIPLINPDGYAQSSVLGVRENLRPRDLNGDGTPFSDPYIDVDGDGYIATLYRGCEDTPPDRFRTRPFGMESLDLDANGLMGDDPINGGVDLNRTFGMPGDEREPETRAIEEFLRARDICALASLHTGLQCVLYPWGCRAYDEALDARGDIPFMRETAQKMADAFRRASGRGAFACASYDDYPTEGELIDFAYDQLGAHAYTVEVYRPGKSLTSDKDECRWEDTLPASTMVFYSREQLSSMGIDVSNVRDFDGEALAPDEGLWFYTSPTAKRADTACAEQALIAEAARQALLIMIESESIRARP